MCVRGIGLGNGLLCNFFSFLRLTPSLFLELGCEYLLSIFLLFEQKCRPSKRVMPLEDLILFITVLVWKWPIVVVKFTSTIALKHVHVSVTCCLFTYDYNYLDDGKGI